MSDMQMRGQMPPRGGGGRPQPGGGGQPTADQTMESMRSPLNPTDLAVMSEQQGQQIDPQRTTVRELFAMQGVDVDGPVIQLVQKMEKDMGNANPANKMQAMAQSAPAPNPMDAKMQGGSAGGPGGPGGAPPEDPLAALMGG